MDHPLDNVTPDELDSTNENVDYAGEDFGPGPQEAAVNDEPEISEPDGE